MMAEPTKAKGGGEKYVVLHDMVLGHTRGAVVSAEALGEGQVERLLKLRAIRPAEGDEARQEQIAAAAPAGLSPREALKVRADAARAEAGALEQQQLEAQGAAGEPGPADEALQEQIDAARKRHADLQKQLEKAGEEQARKQAEAPEKGHRRAAAHEVGKGTPPPPMPPKK
jgi:hypothetical protein